MLKVSKFKSKSKWFLNETKHFKYSTNLNVLDGTYEKNDQSIVKF